MTNSEFYINCDGTRLHVKMDFPAEKKEQYPLFIVIHGFTGYMEEDHITGVSQKLNDLGFATLRADMYGHGASEGTFAEHHLLLWLSEIIRLVDYTRTLPYISDIYLTGHSQGGAAVILAGAILQDRLTAIAPMSPAVLLKENALNGCFLGHPYDPENMPETLNAFDTKSLSTNHLRVDRFLPFEEAVAAFHKPVLLIHADADEMVPYSCSVDLAQKYSNAKLVTIHNDDHCYHAHLEEVLKAFEEFFRK